MPSFVPTKRIRGRLPLLRCFGRFWQYGGAENLDAVEVKKTQFNGISLQFVDAYRGAAFPHQPAITRPFGGPKSVFRLLCGGAGTLESARLLSTVSFGAGELLDEADDPPAQLGVGDSGERHG
jgi:hypothetical protein